MKFYVTIEEMASDTFEIEAASTLDAMEIAEKGYRKGKYVLAPGNLVCKQMQVESAEEGCTEWTEF